MSYNRVWPYWLAVLPSVLAGIGLLLVFANAVLALANRAIQTDVNVRAQYVNQTVQLERISQAIVQAAATAAINNKDTRLGDLLAANGITIQAPSAGASPAPASTVTPPASGTAAGTTPTQPGRGGR